MESHRQMTAEDWSPRLSILRETLESIGEDLPVEDDWMPHVVIECKPPVNKKVPLPPDFNDDLRGKEATIVVAYPDLFQSESGKDLAAHTMATFAIALNARSIMFVSCAWTSIQTEGQPHIVPSEDPNRKEKMMVLAVAYGGPDDGVKYLMADINRSGTYPTLENWTIQHQEAEFSGRFAVAILEGLKIAASIRESGLYDETND